ncbi:transposase family protein [Burkholderia pseudomallei MSHR5855]|nr:transposase family protein [Burkholderia pseudomallei MSHR5855]AIP42173.1 transposase family protein [Burkholderia pseudomallei MSHR5848]
MKKSKFTEEQIAYALKQAELGTPVAEVCRKMGISDATFYIYGLLPIAKEVDGHGSRLRTYIRRQGIAQRPTGIPHVQASTTGRPQGPL